MGRGVDMRFSDPGAGGFGIQKRSWFGDGRRRPAFMEPLGGVPPPNGGSYARLAGGVSSVGVPPRDGGFKRVPASEDVVSSGVGYGGGYCGELMKRSSSSFPIKDDAGYIGYLSDDESGGGDRHCDSTVARRRRELLGSNADVSFSGCLFMMITVCGLLMLFLFAVSPWGVPPPRRL
jgi:hypothetical protein